MDFCGYKVSFSNEKEKSDFERYQTLKGKFATMQAVRLLSAYHEKSPVPCAEVSSLLRYDKSVRRELYVFLAAAEEYWKALLCAAAEITDRDADLWKDGFSFAAPKESGSNLFFALSEQGIDLGRLLSLMKKAGVGIDYAKADAVRILRNSVMHHDFICLGTSDSVEGLRAGLSAVESQIICLHDCLPPFYRVSLQKDLNRCLKLGEPGFTPIHLGAMFDGKFDLG